MRFYRKMELVQEKKGGPYTKKQRLDRRSEVFKLHFEYGYPATQIAKIMKINKNTINNDIKQAYSQLEKDWYEYDFTAHIMKQISRFESQRTRLLKELEKQNEFKEKLVTEKIIYEIDCKITQIFLNGDRRIDDIMRVSTKRINNWAEKNNVDIRALSRTDILKTSSEKYKLIRQILDAANMDFELKEKQKSAGNLT